MRILVLGATGMLGSAVVKVFHSDHSFNVWGTVRQTASLGYFNQDLRSKIITGINVLDLDSLIDVLVKVRPDVVINCVGLIKQLSDAKNPLVVLPINAMLPHRLSAVCALLGARLIHVSTDCVFSGKKGGYTEMDISDAEDLYGKSKFIGELNDQEHAVTLRTSIIGHELNSSYALLDWFLSQTGAVKGFAKAIFSGLPTMELARVIKDFVIPNRKLCGLYHVSVDAIDKLSLLKLISKVYEHDIEIIPDEAVRIDRSLDSTRFRLATGYTPPSWPELITMMHDLR